MDNPRIKIYPHQLNQAGVVGEPTTLVDYFQMIENGRWQELIKETREAKTEGKEAYEKFKKEHKLFPCACLTGWWDGERKKSNSRNFVPNGRVHIDQDNNPIMIEDPRIEWAWPSRSGQGWQYLVPVNGIKDWDTYEIAWELVIEEIFKDVADRESAGANRVGFVSHGKVYHNENPDTSLTLRGAVLDLPNAPAVREFARERGIEPQGDESDWQKLPTSLCHGGNSPDGLHFKANDIGGVSFKCWTNNCSVNRKSADEEISDDDLEKTFYETYKEKLVNIQGGDEGRLFAEFTGRWQDLMPSKEPSSLMVHLWKRRIIGIKRSKIWDIVMRMKDVKIMPNFYGIEVVSPDVFDNRTEHMVFPLRGLSEAGNYRCIDLKDREKKEYQAEWYMKNHGHEGAMEPDFSLLDKLPANPDKDSSDPTEVMYWFCKEQIGMEFIARVGFLLRDIVKDITHFIIPTSDAGKSTFFRCLQLALGEGAVVIMDSSQAFGKGSQYTPALSAMEHAFLLILEEADKVTFAPENYNKLGDDPITIREMYKNTQHDVKRFANAILNAGDFIQTGTDNQGVAERTKHIWKNETAEPITPAIRAQLLKPQALTLLSTLVLQAAYIGYDGTSSATQEAAQEWLQIKEGKVLKAMREVLVADENGEEWSSDIAQALTYYDNTIKPEDLEGRAMSWIKKINPKAYSKNHGKKGRKWYGVRLTKDMPPVFKDMSDA